MRELDGLPSDFLRQEKARLEDQFKIEHEFYEKALDWRRQGLGSVTAVPAARRMLRETAALRNAYKRALYRAEMRECMEVCSV